jgi:hypothetical protein
VDAATRDVARWWCLTRLPFVNGELNRASGRMQEDDERRPVRSPASGTRGSEEVDAIERQGMARKKIEVGVGSRRRVPGGLAEGGGGGGGWWRSAAATAVSYCSYCWLFRVGLTFAGLCAGEINTLSPSNDCL